jgi:hypothetical protein
MREAPREPPHFQPWERFMLLSHALEEVPSELGGELLVPLSSCAMIVVRQLMGQKEHIEAYYAIERLRLAVEERRRRPEPVNRGTMEG